MNFQSQQAIYLQIADYISEQILMKQWMPNYKIPSSRELAVNIGVNPNTVIRTYSFLEEKNIIVMRRGIGYFVTDTAYQNIITLKKEEFLTRTLPSLFKSMDILNINFKELNQIYKNYKK